MSFGIAEVRLIAEALSDLRKIGEMLKDLAEKHQLEQNAHEEKNRNALAHAAIADACAGVPELCPTCPYARPVSQLDSAVAGAPGVQASRIGGSQLDGSGTRKDQPAGS